VKQLITFVFIALFTFYQLGYYFIYFFSQQRLENAWIDKIFQENDGFQNQKMLEIPFGHFAKTGIFSTKLHEIRKS